MKAAKQTQRSERRPAELVADPSPGALRAMRKADEYREKFCWPLEEKARKGGEGVRVAEQPVQLGSIVSHPLRIKILIALTERKASPAELAREFCENLGNVAYHFKQLLKANAIHEVDSQPANGSVEHFFRAIQRPEMSDEQNAALSPAKRLEWARMIWLLMAADVATAMEAGTLTERPDLHIARFPTQVDEEGWEELKAVYAGALEQAKDIEARSAGRMVEDPSSPAIPIRVNALVYEMPSK